jgi:outer membrane protein
MVKQVFLKTTRLLAVLAAALLCAGAAAESGAHDDPKMPAGEELTLDQALTLALQQNRELAIAGLDVGRAQERTAAARTRLRPQFSLSAQGGQLLNEVHTHFSKGALGTTADGSPLPYKDTDVSSGQHFSATANASVSQPLTQIPRLRMGVELEEIGTGIAREQQREQRQSLIASVRSNYYSILQTQSAIEAGEESLKACRELERTTSDFVAQQAALRSDLLDVQARTAQQELTLLKLRNNLAHQKETLNVLLGRDVQTAFRVVPVSTADLPNGVVRSLAADPAAAEQRAVAADDDLQALRQRALQARPDLRRSVLLVQQAETSRRTKQKEFMPDLSLGVNYYQFYTGIQGLPDHVWTAGFQISWDPFDWGKRRREVAELRKSAEQARATLQEKRQRALMEVNDAARRRAESQEQVRVAQAAHSAVRERLRETMNRYQLKEVLLKDALEAQADLADANRQVQEATLQLFTAEADVAKAMGED